MNVKAYSVSLFFLILSFLVFQSTWIPILDSVNLIFHEAGHTILILFGRTIHFLGGTLGQLAIPTLLAFYFFYKKNLLSSAIMTWWLGQNMINIALYISDARSQALPLIGGEHDWFFLLDQWSILHLDTIIGLSVKIIGLMIMVTSSIFMFFILSRRNN